MSQQVPAGGHAGLVLPGGKKDLAAEGVSPGVQEAGRLARLAIRVHLHVGEAVMKARFEKAPLGRLEPNRSSWFISVGD